jgi:hypothetical protein
VRYILPYTSALNIVDAKEVIAHTSEHLKIKESTSYKYL